MAFRANNNFKYDLIIEDKLIKDNFVNPVEN